MITVTFTDEGQSSRQVRWDYDAHTFSIIDSGRVLDVVRVTELSLDEANAAASGLFEAWQRLDDGQATKPARHTCGGPVFGKKTPGCPRCDELLAGAEPVQWASSKRQDDVQRSLEIRMHDCKASGCSIVCTFGEW